MCSIIIHLNDLLWYLVWFMYQIPGKPIPIIRRRHSYCRLLTLQQQLTVITKLEVVLSCLVRCSIATNKAVFCPSEGISRYVHVLRARQYLPQAMPFRFNQLNHLPHPREYMRESTCWYVLLSLHTCCW